MDNSQVDLSNALVEGVLNSFRQIGTSGKIVLGIILAFLLFPVVLRILSFFRRGGEGV